MALDETPNRNQAELWNEASGRTWAELQTILDRMLVPFETRLIAEACPGAGGRVLDLGCGAGATTLAMARMVGAMGVCVGIDISAPLVAAAKARADAAGLPNAAFVLGDAQTYAFDDPAFDAAISRFGVMFFDAPEAAFANIRRAIRPDGSLTFVAWRSPRENPLVVATAAAAAPFLPTAAPPAPDAPGQFAFADGKRVRRILRAGGWRDVSIEPIDLPCSAPQAELMSYATRLGPVGAFLRDADPDVRMAVTRALEAALQPFVHDGSAHFTSACWLVKARA